MAFGKRAPGIVTQTVEDPLKQAVANPMSKFLSEQTGQGVSRYEGPIMSDYTSSQKMSADKFMNIDPHNYFEQNIKAPAINQFQEQLALSQEDFAGRMSGSDRLRTNEDSISRFTRDLATSQAQFETTMPQQQFAMATQMKQERDRESAAQYQDWYKSLPQFNPALEQSLKFLQDSTSTGTDVLSYLDPGQKGGFGSFGAMAGFAIGALLALPTGGLSMLAAGTLSTAALGTAALGGALGGAVGAGAGSLLD